MRAWILICLSLCPLLATADGAFPDSSQLLAPEGTKRLYLSTTFGLISSEDDGATWFWTCEEAIGPNVMQYQAGAGDQPILYSIDADQRLSISRDVGRSWSLVDDALVKAGYVYDVFPDPVNRERVVGLYSPKEGGGVTSKVIESVDGGTSFQVIYTAPEGSRLVSVEIARSSPAVVWTVVFSSGESGFASSLVRLEAGKEPVLTPLTPSIGAGLARIASVDPVDSGTLYLRITGRESGKDSLAIVRDHGAQITLPLTIDGAMSGFLRRESGELLVASVLAGAMRSTDGGATFSPWTGQPAFRAFAERNGVLHVAADNFKDGFAVGRLEADGAWSKLLVWDELCGIVPSSSLEVICKDPWAKLVDVFRVSSAVQCPRPPGPPVTPENPSTPSVTTDARPGCGCGSGVDPVMAFVVVTLLGRASRRRR